MKIGEIMNPNIELLNVDCMEYMAGLPDKAFDLAIVDPPYGIDVFHKRGGGKIGGAKPFGNSRNGKVITPKSYRGFDDTRIPEDKYFEELKRVSKNQVIWGGNYFIKHLTNTPCMLVWDKDNSGNFSDCELAWASFPTAVRKFKYRWNGMLQQDMKNKEERIHATQKPVALYKWVLQNYAKVGDKVLDTHLGSASSAIAAFEMGFDFVGTEIDKVIHGLAVNRFNNHISQGKLFNPNQLRA